MPTHIYKNPDNYSKNNALQYNFAMKMLKKVSFHDKSRVLDIGSGDGLITSEIAKIANNGCIIGTDISAPMVEHASKAYLSQDNLRFVQMDASKNIFRKQFDIITSFNCLHWVKNQEAALRGIYDAGDENASIVLLLSHKKSSYHHALDAVCSSSKWKSYFHNYENPRSFFDPEEYKKLVTSTGLNITEFAEEEMTHYYENKDQLIEFFRASMANIAQIPTEKKDEFLNDFSNEFISRVANESKDNIPVSFWCLQILATKSPSLKLENESNSQGSEHRSKMFSNRI